MKQKDIEFPQYRKYKNGLSYFKIINPDKLIEIRIIGSKSIVTELNAVQLPERNFIHDLLFNYRVNAVQIEAEEFEKRLN